MLIYNKVSDILCAKDVITIKTLHTHYQHSPVVVQTCPRSPFSLPAAIGIQSLSVRNIILVLLTHELFFKIICVLGKEALSCPFVFDHHESTFRATNVLFCHVTLVSNELLLL